jgi:hypothetical protein
VVVGTDRTCNALLRPQRPYVPSRIYVAASFRTSGPQTGYDAIEKRCDIVARFAARKSAAEPKQADTDGATARIGFQAIDDLIDSWLLQAASVTTDPVPCGLSRPATELF